MNVATDSSLDGWMLQTSSPVTSAQVLDAQTVAATNNLSIESKNDEPTSAEIVNWATVFAIALALGILAMSIGLIRSETASELRTLTATGASSRTRRSLTAVTAGGLAFLGALLGTVAAYVGLAGWFHSNSLEGGLSNIIDHIPWNNLFLIVIAMPAVAVIVGWVLAGRDPTGISAPSDGLGESPVEPVPFEDGRDTCVVSTFAGPLPKGHNSRRRCAISTTTSTGGEAMNGCRQGRHGGKATSGRRVGTLVGSVLAAASLMVPLGVLGGSATASAATPSSTTCAGTPTSPASLPGGTYTSVSVTGACAVNAGQVIVTGDVTVAAGAALVAAFANNDVGGSGTSGLTVNGNIDVDSGGTLLLGCEALHFSCIDDPNQSNPTLNSRGTVQGSLIATDPLGVVIHDSTIGGDAIQSGGGGGVNCTPSGIFAQFMSPVYSDYEDNTIGGNLRITGLNSCWLGGLRNNVGGSVTYSDNTLNDPDANEILSSHIAGNLLCSGNSPGIEYGDSSEDVTPSTPNVVGGFATGQCAFSVEQPRPAPVPGPGGNPAGPLTPIALPSSTPPGYWLAAKDGGVFSFGAPFLGSEAGQSLSQPIAGMAAVPGGGSYNLADANGAAYGFGPHASDCTGLTATLNKPVVGIAPAPGGNGCWLAASDGGVFAFGSNAPFFGSAGSLTLNQPVVGLAAAPGNTGYDLVAADGGVFTYGPGATFQGSMGGQHLNQPIVGMATDPVTGGYWLVAADGGIFSFDAPFFGSLGSQKLNKPIVGIAAAPTGDGYYLVASDGGVFAFGTGAHFQGSTGGIVLNQPVVGMALG